MNMQEKEVSEVKPKPKVPEIHAPPAGGTQLETPKIEVIREPTPDRKSSLAPGVYCLVANNNKKYYFTQLTAIVHKCHKFIQCIEWH
jgi:hypothetical protein